jgi:cell shape-determining protein MreD
VTRSLVLALVTLVLTAAVGALALPFGVSSLPVVPGVMIVAYAALVNPPVEAAISAALCGLVMDALAGTPLGVNVLACVLVLVASRLVVGWVTSARGVQAALFVAGLSAAWAFISLSLLLLAQTRQSAGLSAVPLLALTNGLASFAVLPVLNRLLVVLRLEEKGESLQERLAQKGRSSVG